MHFSDLKKTIIAQFMAPNGHQVVPFIEGRPGGGKSACAREVAGVLKETFKISDEQIVEFNPSLRDPVDIMGIPFRNDMDHSSLPKWGRISLNNNFKEDPCHEQKAYRKRI